MHYLAQKTDKTSPLVIENEKRSELSTLSKCLVNGKISIRCTWNSSSIWLVSKFSGNQKVWFHAYDCTNSWLWYFRTPHWLGYFVLMQSLPTIHTFHQSVKQIHWYEAIFKIFGSASFEAIEVKGRSRLNFEVKVSCLAKI